MSRRRRVRGDSHRSLSAPDIALLPHAPSVRKSVVATPTSHSGRESRHDFAYEGLQTPVASAEWRTSVNHHGLLHRRNPSAFSADILMKRQSETPGITAPMSSGGPSVASRGLHPEAAMQAPKQSHKFLATDETQDSRKLRRSDDESAHRYADQGAVAIGLSSSPTTLRRRC